MIQINNPADCCGCTACASICAHDAITMKPDALGFLYPEVDKDKCVDCGLCEKVCAFNDHYDTSLNLEKPLAYGARHKDMNEVETSRSGAAFIAISDYILEQGGVVYGAGYTDHFRVVHKRATTKEERDEFKGSKYVQSDMTGVFRQVKKDLRDGLTVLFSGTPCQTAGLKSYIGKNLKLILVDIICDGVPSPRFFADYIKYLEHKYNHSISVFLFRDKAKFGWASHNETASFGEFEISSYKYTYIFYKRILTRDSCGACKYTNLRRPSDITLADFWGYERSCSSLNNDNKGISLLLVNTDKGKQLFNDAKEKMITQKVEIEEALQPNLINTHPLNEIAKQCKLHYQKYGFRFIFLFYGQTGLLSLLKKIKDKFKR